MFSGVGASSYTKIGKARTRACSTLLSIRNATGVAYFSKVATPIRTWRIASISVAY